MVRRYRNIQLRKFPSCGPPLTPGLWGMSSTVVAIHPFGTSLESPTRRLHFSAMEEKFIIKGGELRSTGGVISIVPFLSFAIVQRHWTQLLIWME